MEGIDARLLLRRLQESFATLRTFAYKKHLALGRDWTWGDRARLGGFGIAEQRFDGGLSVSVWLTKQAKSVILALSVLWNTQKWLVDASVELENEKDDPITTWLWSKALECHGGELLIAQIDQLMSELLEAGTKVDWATVAEPGPP